MGKEENAASSRTLCGTVGLYYDSERVREEASRLAGDF